MPAPSRFYGIVITMYFFDHGRPHFHARYGGHKASIDVETLDVVAGSLPPRVFGLVAEWGGLHRDALLAAWEAGCAGRLPSPIPPLE